MPQSRERTGASEAKSVWMWPKLDSQGKKDHPQDQDSTIASNNAAERSNLGPSPLTPGKSHGRPNKSLPFGGGVR
ncbi:MAG: hypothetical protein WCP28_12635 [Actinomycetes bacterium]